MIKKIRPSIARKVRAPENLAPTGQSSSLFRAQPEKIRKNQMIFSSIDFFSREKKSKKSLI